MDDIDEASTRCARGRIASRPTSRHTPMLLTVTEVEHGACSPIVNAILIGLGAGEDPQIWPEDGSGRTSRPPGVLEVDIGGARRWSYGGA